MGQRRATVTLDSRTKIEQSQRPSRLYLLVVGGHQRT